MYEDLKRVFSWASGTIYNRNESEIDKQICKVAPGHIFYAENCRNHTRNCFPCLNKTLQIHMSYIMYIVYVYLLSSNHYVFIISKHKSFMESISDSLYILLCLQQFPLLLVFSFLSHYYALARPAEHEWMMTWRTKVNEFRIIVLSGFLSVKNVKHVVFDRSVNRVMFSARSQRYV